MLLEFIGRLRASALARKITRYALGSVFALLTSIVTFALLYVAGVGTTACSVTAFVAGAVPNWILNRRWAWEISGRVAFLREMVGYVTVSILALVASSRRPDGPRSRCRASRRTTVSESRS